MQESLSNIAALLEGLLGIVAVSGAGLAALEACELMSRHMVACSGAMVRVTSSGRSPMNKSFLSCIGGLAMVVG